MDKRAVSQTLTEVCGLGLKVACGLRYDLTSELFLNTVLCIRKQNKIKNQNLFLGEYKIHRAEVHRKSTDPPSSFF